MTCEHQGNLVDVVVSKMALHHLPDFWKQVALLRINKMLKSGGVFYLADVVFQMEPKKINSSVNKWISEFEQKCGTEFINEVKTHIRDEYSTFGWVLKGLLEKAGFAVERIKTTDEFVSEWLCRKIG